MRKAISIILVVSFLMSLFVVTVGATQTRVDYFNKSYTLTGDPAYDIASIAEAQIGKTGASFGYTEHWCADFVSDCARLAGISTAVIPYTGGVSNMYNAMISSGATRVSSPQRGDLAFYSNASGWCHVAVMTDSVNSVHGNVNGQEGNFINTSYVTKCSYGSYTGGTATFVRPTYTPVSYNTVSIPKGQYMIWNHGSGNQLVVEQSADVSQQNIGVHPITPESGMKFEIIEESNGHSIRPHCSLTRVVNVYADAVSSGNNVNLFTNTPNDGTQRWLFEPVDNGLYIIRNAQNPSCVLTQQNEGYSSNCIVADYTGSNHQKWGLKPIETEKPVISNAQISDITADGYTISCTVADNVEVRRVRFPTWTVAGDQDDLLWADGTINGTTATFRVNKSDHKNEYGEYVTHIYAYDSSGNECVFMMKVNFTETGAVITEPAPEEETYLTVTIETVEHAGVIAAGEEITLDLTTSAAEQLNALNMRLCFDETKFEFVGGEFQNTLAGFAMKSFNSEPVDCQTEDAEVWFTAIDTDGYVSVADGEVIATITLRALTSIVEDEAVYSYYCAAASYDSTMNDYVPVVEWVDGGVVIGDHPKGDVNLDGNVDLNDATRLFYYVNGMVRLSEDALKAADYTDNGTVDLNDATRLFYYINGLA